MNFWYALCGLSYSLNVFNSTICIFFVCIQAKELVAAQKLAKEMKELRTREYDEVQRLTKECKRNSSRAENAELVAKKQQISLGKVTLLVKFSF